MRNGLVKNDILFLLVVVISATTLSACGLVQRERVYRSKATILVRRAPPSRHDADTKPAQRVEGPWEDYVLTQQHILNSRLLRSRARQRVDRPADDLNAVRTVRIERVFRGPILSVTVDSLDPVLSAEYANALVEAYVDFKAEERLDSTQAIVLSLTQQANRILEEVKKTEERLVAFRKDHPGIAASHGGAAAEQVWNLNREIADLKTKRLKIEALVKAAPHVDEAVLREAVRGVGVVLEQGAATQAELAAQAEGLEMAEQTALELVRSWQEEAQQQDLERGELENLERQVARLRSLYDLLFNRLKEVDVRVGHEPETVKILEHAVPSTAPLARRLFRGR